MDLGVALWPREAHEWLELSLESIPSVSITIIGSKENEPLVPLALLLVDGDSPGPHFLHYLIQLSEEYSVPPMIVLGSPNSSALRSIDWEGKDIVFISKPYHIENVKSVVRDKLAEIHSLSSQKKTTDSSKIRSLGYLSTLRLEDLIQMLTLNLWTGKIVVHHLQTGEIGEVYINVGVLVHALGGNKEGEEACYTMLTWGRCEFSFIEEYTPVAQTIKSTWQTILLEGARLMDESKRRVIK